MEASLNEITVNGKQYVEKNLITKEKEIIKDYVIVRTYSAGVHAGELIKQEGKEVILKNARRIWYWVGSASLSQLAMEGTKKPDKCKFPCTVGEIKLTEAIEIISTTVKARESIQGVEVWRE